MCSVKKKGSLFPTIFSTGLCTSHDGKDKIFPVSVLSNDDFACHITGLGGVEWLYSKPTAASSLTYEKYDLSSWAQSLKPNMPRIIEDKKTFALR